MCDNNLSFLQDIESWQDEEPTVVPPLMCAEAVRLNRFSIVGVLVNPEKQSMSALINQMPCIWGVTEKVIGRVIDSRRFQFVFKTEDAMNRVLEKSPWYFADRLIVLKRWAPTVTEESLKKVQFWVQIRGIPPHYLSRAIVDFVGDKLGQVVDVEFDDSTNLTDYVWVLVNWNIDNPLRFKRNYEFGVGEIHMLSFHYDRLMNFCNKCGMLTHDVKECPLHIDDDACKWRDDGVSGDKACGLSVDEEGQVVTNAFAEKAMKVGSSGDSSVPISYIPPIDCDKLAETLRYVKAKLVKGKSLMGPKLGPADAISMPVCCQENDLYNPKSADENLVKKPYYGNSLGLSIP